MRSTTITLLVCMASLAYTWPTNSKPQKYRPLERAITFTKPILPLEFQEKVRRKPKEKNLEARKLLKKMGEDFQPHWMAIDPPDQKDLLSVEMSSEQVIELEAQISSLNLEEELKNLVEPESDVDPQYEDDEENEEDNEIMDSSSSSISSRSGINSRSIALFQQWLIKKSSCPVTFEWQDLGEYFWPRWIRRGHCSENEDNDHPKSTFAASSVGCSWPLGMTCVPGEAVTLHILRWHCRRRRVKKGRNGSRYKCKWYKVPYPVTNTCKCACQ